METVEFNEAQLAQTEQVRAVLSLINSGVIRHLDNDKNPVLTVTIQCSQFDDFLLAIGAKRIVDDLAMTTNGTNHIELKHVPIKNQHRDIPGSLTHILIYFKTLN